MRATLSPDNPTEKRAKLAGCSISVFRLLRMFWVTELILLLVVSYGLYAGWSGPKQWSDAFFYAAAAQVFIAAIPKEGSLRDIAGSSEVRFIPKGNITEIRGHLEQIAMRQESFSVRVLIGSLLTFLLAVLCMRL